MTPALAEANNGNWQTARRWARLLAGHYRVRLLPQWSVAEAQGDDALLIALHARRSAGSVAAWANAHPDRPLVVTLTGTDLYRDIRTDASAQASLEMANALVVLQDQAPLDLAPHLRAKCRVVYQSSTRRAPWPKSEQGLRAVMVGHLREEKSPETFMAAAHLLRDDARIRLDHIGAALDDGLARQALETAAACPAYRWLGALPHEATRRRIQRAHVLVHASRMEGGAHVIMEAVMSGTPVLASRVPGNVGMLGPDYAGYFALGDARGLADALRACAADLGPGGWLARLQRQCEERSALFEPSAERAALLALVADLLGTRQQP